MNHFLAHQQPKLVQYRQDYTYQSQHANENMLHRCLAPLSISCLWYLLDRKRNYHLPLRKSVRRNREVR